MINPPNNTGVKFPDIGKTSSSASSRHSVTKTEVKSKTSFNKIRGARMSIRPVVTVPNPDQVAADVKYARLHEIFQSSEEDGEPGLSISEFKRAMRKTVGHNLTDDQIEVLFMKVDANCDGVVDWEEYVTYNLLEYQERTIMYEMLKDKPFPPEIREIGSRHRDMIVRISFFPSIQKRIHSGTIDYATGKYVTLSKEGVVSFWSLKMKHLKSYTTHTHTDRATQPWLIDLVCMYNVNMLAVTSTDREIIIFDLQANKFQKRYFLTGIENCITTMNYWASLQDLNKAILIWGDTGGNIYVIVFDSCLRGGPFGTPSGKATFKRVSLPEVLRHFTLGVKGYKLSNIHDDWVSQVAYIPQLHCFLSCCQSSKTSMYFGDIEKKKTSTYFSVNKGILAFDYCPENNIIVTGGMDYLVRVWNPYVNNKAIVVLMGHSKPVTHMVINAKKNQVVSIDKGRTIRVFDLKDQTCVQQISGRVVKLGPFPLSSIYFNPKLQSLILATNQIAVLERNVEEEKCIEVISHNKPIFAALYNKTFGSVVSACNDSVVSVWDLGTGEKVIQFVNAHKKVERGVEIPIEITAMTFDPPGRRLLTGARDGSVKVWNFNNGACLQQFRTPEGLDITGIVCTQHRIYVTGWCQTIHIYIDGAGEEHLKTWRPRHKDDILCMSCLNPNIIATGSYDGDVIVWSRDTGQVYCTLNAFVTKNPIAENKQKKGSLQELETDQDDDEPLSNRSTGMWRGKIGTKATGAMHLISRFRERASIVGRERRMSRVVNRDDLLSLRSPSPHLSDESGSSQSRLSSQAQDREEYDNFCKTYEAGIEKILFLEKRDTLNKNTAMLLTSGAEGWIRAWSIHHLGGLLGQFNGGHRVGESIYAMATDGDNEYLFTGDTMGVVKVWDITEYCTRHKYTAKDRESRWKHLYKTFTYLRVLYSEDDVPKSLTSRSLKPENIGKRPPPLSSEPRSTFKYPLLVNSYRAHTKSISNIEFVDDRKVIITTSHDCSIRVWTLNGLFIGSFGETWAPLPKAPVIVHSFRIRIPQDLKRIGSAKSLKVLNHGRHPLWRYAYDTIKTRGLDKAQAHFDQQQKQQATKNVEKVSEDYQIEAELESSKVLGKSYKRKVRHKMPPTIPKFIETAGSVSTLLIIRVQRKFLDHTSGYDFVILSNVHPKSSVL